MVLKPGDRGVVESESTEPPSARGLSKRSCVRSPRRATGFAGMTDGRASTRRLPAPCVRPGPAGRRRARAAQATGISSRDGWADSSARVAPVIEHSRSVPAFAADKTREAAAQVAPTQERTRRRRETCRSLSCPPGSTAPGNNGRSRPSHLGRQSSWAAGPPRPRPRPSCLAWARPRGAPARRQHRATRQARLDSRFFTRPRAHPASRTRARELAARRLAVPLAA